MTQSLTLALAEYAASTSIETIPDEVKERAKLVIMDEMACAQFGRRSIAGELAARYATTLGGPAEARILGTGMRVPAPHAALANGTAGHGEEVDGAHVVGGHPGASIVHAAVAVAERQRVPGAELLNAVVLGYDVGIRAMQACGGIFEVKSRHHLHADFLYAVGAAAAASRILGLDPVRHCHAMALVTFQANGLYAMYGERRHISKSFCNGQYAFAGVSAALMSAAGLEGSDDILGAQGGLLDAWGVENGAQFVTRGLGQDYAVMGANFKFINAGYPIHAVVEAAMTVVRDHEIDAKTIASVHVGMPGNAMRVVDNRQMHNICVQDMLTAALLRGGLSLRELPFPAILGDPAFGSHAIANHGRRRPGARARPARRTRRQRRDHHQQAGRRSRTASIGREVTAGAVRVTWADLSEKWHDGLAGYDVDRMIALAQRLEDLDDVRALCDAFTETPA